MTVHMDKVMLKYQTFQHYDSIPFIKAYVRNKGVKMTRLTTKIFTRVVQEIPTKVGHKDSHEGPCL